jgi:hypothetical protein
MVEGTAASAAQVRAILTKAGGATKGRGQGYGAAARAEAVAHASKRISAGESRYVVARELGISADTLGGWLKGRGGVGFARVTVTAETTPGATFALISPTGWRIEGLDLHALRALVGEPA